ncbi:MAG: Ig-like domain-containing protein [Duncaniella sp.]|nr:Ig-like domain-containing protein [Duncaniella sp.]
MSVNRNKATSLRLLAVGVIAVAVGAIVAACASIGRPEGGPRDVTPPVYVKSNPRPGATRVAGSRITIDFDENVQLDDPGSKIVISPAQRTSPAISANGRRVTVDLRDTLVPGVTYTIDFADAIKDLNEGNVLDGFALDFATGDSIDTLRISGVVLEARTLEPAQGMLVGVYSAFTDTTLTTVPFERITKTNQLGQFTIRNLKAGSYHIFAINDVNRDYHWDRSEDIAFYDTVITPTAVTVQVTDTLESSQATDSIVTRDATHFLPDDVLLTWFNEEYKTQYLADNARPERNKINLRFGAPADSLPILKLLNTHRRGDDISKWSVLEASAGLDTLTYWITDTTLIANDSLLVEARYRRTDSLENLSWTTDTLRLFMRKARMKKPKKKDVEEADTLPKETPSVALKVSSGSLQELHRPLSFFSATPIVEFDTAGVHLSAMIDSVWYDLPRPSVRLERPGDPMSYLADYRWDEDTHYRLTIDSASVTDLYGLVNRPLIHEFTTKKLSDYSSVRFVIHGLPESVPAMVELLNSSDKPVATAAVEGGEALLSYLNSGTYYARLYVDADSSGTYTAGSVELDRQPEETYYYPRKINLKKNWDIEQTWDINAQALDLQKPLEIKKNKPKDSKAALSSTDDEEEEDTFNYSDPFTNPGSERYGRGAFSR